MNGVSIKQILIKFSFNIYSYLSWEKNHFRTLHFKRTFPQTGSSMEKCSLASYKGKRSDFKPRAHLPNNFHQANVGLEPSKKNRVAPFLSFSRDAQQIPFGGGFKGGNLHKYLRLKVVISRTCAPVGSRG